MEKTRENFRKQWKKEFSAGGVVLRKTKSGNREILLIQPASRSTYWVFPKGWVDEGETVEQAALREVREEGGVSAQIRADLGEVKYIFQWEGERISKTVRYFLMDYISGNPKDHDSEVMEARWVPFDETKGMLSYRTDKEVFERTLNELEKSIG